MRKRSGACLEYFAPKQRMWMLGEGVNDRVVDRDHMSSRIEMDSLAATHLTVPASKK
jgi:hypothetical protein